MSDTPDISLLQSQARLWQAAVTALEAVADSKYWVISVAGDAAPVLSSWDTAGQAAAAVATYRGQPHTYAYVLFGKFCQIEKGPTWYLHTPGGAVPLLRVASEPVMALDGAMDEPLSDIVLEAAACDASPPPPPVIAPASLPDVDNADFEPEISG